MKRIIHRHQATAIFGFLVIITPFLGIPNFFRTLILVVLGGLIVTFGLTAKHRLTGMIMEETVTSYQLPIEVDDSVAREKVLT